jgi:hypothetical protein
VVAAAGVAFGRVAHGHADLRRAKAVAVGELHRDVARAVGASDAERLPAAQVLVGTDLEMVRIRPPVEVRRLEQPRVGLAHRPRPRQRTEIGRPLLAPTLADPPRHPAQKHRPHQRRRHRRHQQQHRLPRLETELARPPPPLRRPSPHRGTVAGSGLRVHAHLSRICARAETSMWQFTLGLRRSAMPSVEFAAA